jgi:hypothetical protein
MGHLAFQFQHEDPANGRDKIPVRRQTSPIHLPARQSFREVSYCSQENLPGWFSVRIERRC